MAISLVTDEQAKAHLRIDDDAHDDWLETFIPAISEAVATWLKDEWRLYEPEYDSNGIVVDSSGDPVPAVDENGDYTPRKVVQAAVLIELASQFRFREGEGTDNVVPGDAGHGYILNKTSTAILSGLRKATLA